MKSLKKVMVISMAVLGITFGGITLASNLNLWGGEEDVNDIYESVDTLDSMLHVKEEQRNEAKNKSKQLEEKLSSVTRDFEKNKEVVDQASKDLEERATHILSLQDSLAQATESNELTQQEIHNKQANIDKLKTMLADEQLNNTVILKDTTERLTHYEDVIAELENDYAVVTKEVTSLNGEINRVAAERDNLYARYNELGKEVDEKELQLEKARGEVEGLRKYIQEKEANHYNK